ncbi:type-2 ice-structuring protein-like isoform X2 [Macrobrachium rosenbergii]|uniref:C-type lectin n=1 Tax=Macrobrachium rosenbergii TaxID=79674 RepID=A0A140H144_MACRS|nr:c-type lectin [Macrobrachium rosenbergii]
MTAHQIIRLFMLSMSICMIFGVTLGSALPEPDSPEDSSFLLDEPADEEPSTRLQQQAEDNASAIRRLAEVMKNMVTVTANQRCLGTGTSAQQLTDSIKEGFSVLVGAVQDLNTTMRHFNEDLSKRTTSAGATVFEDDGPCPAPFFLAGEDCLYIETETLRYFDAARQACIEMGAKLAEFTTYDHFISAVSAMDMHEDAEIYIGGTDREHEGTWKWLSGESMRRIPWGSGEPNNLYLEDCIALKPRWKKFNDMRCSLRREYVCKWQH